MDNLTRTQRSICMSRIRSKNTKPELIVREILRGLKIRYRLHSKTLPGKPDIVISSKRTAIFINGCFWHQHKNCRRQAMPKTNTEYWHKKLERNIEKQKSILRELKRDNWKSIIVWECQVKQADSLTRRLKKGLM